MRTLYTLSVVAACLACDDGAATAMDAGDRLPRGADAAPPPGDAAPRSGDADAPSGDAGAPPDAAPDAAPPPPGCADDDACPGPDICYDGRCIPNARCDEATPCAVAQRCIAGICVADPNAAGALVAEPETLGYTFSRVGETQTRGLRITNGGDAVATIVGLETAAPFAVGDVALPARLLPEQTLDVTVDYTADDDLADMGQLRVTTMEGPTLDVPLRSSRKVVRMGDPCLEVAPARLDFGGVARGQVGVQTVRLSACGDVPVNVLAIRRGVSFFGPLPDTFQLDNPPGWPQAIEPGAFIDVGVAYAPRRAGIEGGHFEVVSDDAAEPNKRVEVFALAEPPPLDDIALHVRLEWDTDLTDVDLHLLGPGGQLWTCEGDCYFSNPQPNWGDPNAFRDDPFLDVDDVDGFGPENINLEAPAPGTYRVVVQYWADHGGDVPESVVEVLSFGQVIGRYGPQRTARTDDEWTVVDIEWPAGVLTPLGGVANQPRGALCGGF